MALLPDDRAARAAVLSPTEVHTNEGVAMELARRLQVGQGRAVSRRTACALTVTMVALAAATSAMLAGQARAGSPWNGDGHCQFGSLYNPPAGGIYMSTAGQRLRQCNSTSTADHGDADVGGNGFAVYRTTGGSEQICSGGACGYRWYLRDRGWIHCVWTTAVC
ncbi:MAG: hypothetical protein JWR37_2677 [Mycobacterium sp.]|nr:hypothetical protein [Mycobacterium sp.]